MKFLVLLILIAIGSLFILKTEAIERATGKIGWAERHLGGAGTNAFYKLLGVGLIILGFMYASGLIEGIFGGFFRTVFGGLGSDAGAE